MTISSWEIVPAWTPLNSLDFKLWQQGSKPFSQEKKWNGFLLTSILFKPHLLSSLLVCWGVTGQRLAHVWHMVAGRTVFVAPVKSSSGWQHWSLHFRNVGFWWLTTGLVSCAVLKGEEAPCSKLYLPLGAAQIQPQFRTLLKGHFRFRYPNEISWGCCYNSKFNFCLLPILLPSPSHCCWF